MLTVLPLNYFMLWKYDSAKPATVSEACFQTSPAVVCWRFLFKRRGETIFFLMTKCCCDDWRERRWKHCCWNIPFLRQQQLRLQQPRHAVANQINSNSTVSKCQHYGLSSLSNYFPNRIISVRLAQQPVSLKRSVISFKTHIRCSHFFLVLLDKIIFKQDATIFPDFKLPKIAVLQKNLSFWYLCYAKTTIISMGSYTIRRLPHLRDGHGIFYRK